MVRIRKVGLNEIRESKKGFKWGKPKVREWVTEAIDTSIGKRG